MGFRYRRSVKILPGVRVNFNKKSTSVTVGGKMFKQTFSSNGRRTQSVSLPGTGLYYSKTVGGKKASSPAGSSNQAKESSPKAYKTYGILLVILSILIAAALGVPVLTLWWPAGLIFFLLAAFLLRYGLHCLKKAKEQPQQ